MKHRTTFPIAASILLVLLALPSAAAERFDLEAARATVDQAKFVAGDPEAQAKALTRLAWAERGAFPADPLVAAVARAELVSSGKNVCPALFEALAWADPVYSADIVAAFMEIRESLTAGIPLTYLPAMDRALWTGSVEAKRLAMHNLAAQRFRPDMLAIQDAAIAHPGLMDDALISLTRMRDDRARFFLKDLLEAEDGQYRDKAAKALAGIGGRCRGVLRDAVLSERAEVRRSAITALVPIAGVADLSVLYEYLAKSEEDDPELAAMIRERAQWLESLLEEQREKDSG